MKQQLLNTANAWKYKPPCVRTVETYISQITGMVQWKGVVSENRDWLSGPYRRNQ